MAVGVPLVLALSMAFILSGGHVSQCSDWTRDEQERRVRDRLETRMADGQPVYAGYDRVVFSRAHSGSYQHHVVAEDYWLTSVTVEGAGVPDIHYQVFLYCSGGMEMTRSPNP